MTKYLTQLLGRPVVGPDGARIGRVADLTAEQGDLLPTVAGLLVRVHGVPVWVAMKDARVTARGVELRAPLSSLAPYEPRPDDILLRRDVLDKQIVDVHDYRVVRVNDVRLAECGEGLCVVGADASLRAVLRRAGVAAPFEAMARLARRPLRSNLIAWDNVETLDPSAAGGGRIKLKVPHETIARLHPADIADIVEQLDPRRRAEVIEALDLETAADTIEEMEDAEAAAVMEKLEDGRAADILEEMEPDEAADLLGDLSDARSEELLDQMEPDEAAEVKELLAYDEETAGGHMTTEYIAVSPTMTAEETLAHLREEAPPAESIYYVYVVDVEEHLVGVISLRDLVVAAPETPIADFMLESVRYVHTDDHADEVALTITRYNLLALPVVDDQRRLVGIITVDDMMERLLPADTRRRPPHVVVEE